MRGKQLIIKKGLHRIHLRQCLTKMSPWLALQEEFFIFRELDCRRIGCQGLFYECYGPINCLDIQQYHRVSYYSLLLVPLFSSSTTKNVVCWMLLGQVNQTIVIYSIRYNSNGQRNFLDGK